MYLKNPDPRLVKNGFTNVENALFTRDVTNSKSTVIEGKLVLITFLIYHKINTPVHSDQKKEFREPTFA